MNRNVIFGFLLLSAAVYAEESALDLDYQKYVAAEKLLFDHKGELQELASRQSGNLELMSGLAFLCYRHRQLECAPSVYLAFALDINPQDKPSLLLSTRLDVMRYGYKYSEDLESMNLKIKTAKAHNRDITIDKDSSLAQYFQDEIEKKEDRGFSIPHKLRAQDPNQIFSKMKYILNKEGREVLDSVSKAQKVDDNAIYNYLKAYVYLLMGDTQKGIRELEYGKQKSFQGYLAEQDDRMKLVLDKINYPESMQPYIIDRRVPFEDFVRWRIWKEGLLPYANSLEKEKKYSELREIYQLLSDIAEQCQQDQHRPLGLSSTMKEKLEEIRQKEQQD